MPSGSFPTVSMASSIRWSRWPARFGSVSVVLEGSVAALSS